MPVTIARRTRSSFAVAAALALALSACSPSNGSDESPSDQSTPSGSSSSGASGSASSKAASPTSKSAAPTPVAASSEGPAKNWPVPEMPEAAKEKSSAGLEAFSDYYFDLLTYTIITNDPEPLKKVTSKYCDLCATGFIDPATKNRKSKTWAVGGEYDAKIENAQMVGDKSGSSVWQYKRRKATYYNSDGSVYAVGEASKESIGGTFSATYDRGWKITEISTVKS